MPSRDEIDHVLIKRHGVTSEQLGLDDEMIVAGWAGFQSAEDFVDVLEQEYMIDTLTNGPATRS